MNYIKKKNKLTTFYRLNIFNYFINSEDSFRGAQEIKKKLLALKDIEVLGPVDSPII